MNSRLSFLLVAFQLCLVSCSQGRTLSPLSEAELAFTKDGNVLLVHNVDCNQYYWFVSIDEFRNDLYHSPKGKINSIIDDNPDWQFVCYCHCSKVDSLQIIRVLQRYDCKMPVVIDENGSFLISNGIKERYSDIGFICDKRGRCLGVSTIGTVQSFFDQEFSRVKSSMRNPRLCSRVP